MFHGKLCPKCQLQPSVSRNGCRKCHATYMRAWRAKQRQKLHIPKAENIRSVADIGRRIEQQKTSHNKGERRP